MPGYGIDGVTKKKHQIKKIGPSPGIWDRWRQARAVEGPVFRLVRISAGKGLSLKE